MKETVIKNVLETPRHCRQCGEKTLNFYPSRAKRYDWICKDCLKSNKHLYAKKRAKVPLSANSGPRFMIHQQIGLGF